ncbi:hypothetical protein ACLOJK_027058 [Asimina triloba]
MAQAPQNHHRPLRLDARNLKHSLNRHYAFVIVAEFQARGKRERDVVNSFSRRPARRVLIQLSVASLSSQVVDDFGDFIKIKLAFPNRSSSSTPSALSMPILKEPPNRLRLSPSHQTSLWFLFLAWLLRGHEGMAQHPLNLTFSVISPSQLVASSQLLASEIFLTTTVKAILYLRAVVNSVIYHKTIPKGDNMLTIYIPTLEVTSSQLLASEIFPTTVVKAILYLRAVVNSVIYHKTIPKGDNMLTIYNFTDLKNVSTVPNLQRLEVLARSYFSVVSAFVGLMKPGRLTLFGTLLMGWRLFKEGILGKLVNIDPATTETYEM